MTTYNERLDKILSDHGAEQGEFHYSLKQAITSLIKELVAGAKPQEHIDVYTYPSAKTNDDIRKIAIDQFEQNLLKELEEK